MRYSAIGVSFFCLIPWVGSSSSNLSEKNTSYAGEIKDLKMKEKNSYGIMKKVRQPHQKPQEDVMPYTNRLIHSKCNCKYHIREQKGVTIKFKRSTVYEMTKREEQSDDIRQAYKLEI